MLLDTLERARTQCIANYVCYGEEFTSQRIKNGNFEKRFDKETDNFYNQLEKFAKKLNKKSSKCLKLKGSKKDILLEHLLSDLKSSISSINIIMCELGMQTGLIIASDLELTGYRNERRKNNA